MNACFITDAHNTHILFHFAILYLCARSEWAFNVLPIGLCTSLSLAFANIAYFYLSLSFIQMLKAFAPVITFTVLVAFGLDTYSHHVLAALFVVMSGCFIAAYGVGHVTQMVRVCVLLYCVLHHFVRESPLE